MTCPMSGAKGLLTKCPLPQFAKLFQTLPANSHTYEQLALMANVQGCPCFSDATKSEETKLDLLKNPAMISVSNPNEPNPQNLLDLAKEKCPVFKDMGKSQKEYSVIYTDRATNLMSSPFVSCMQDIMNDLCEVYSAKKCALIPGSGTMGMEAVARQFGTNKKSLVIRNGFFSYRWTQIFEMGVSNDVTVLNANYNEATNSVSPPNVAEVCEKILQEKPSIVCMPHVETSAGLLVSDDYIKQVAEATHKANGQFVLDGIASGTIWVNMEELGVDLYITAPQKGWSAPASVGIVMLSDRALEVMESETSSSFALDLKKWTSVSDAYSNNGFMYHTTTPTDALLVFRNAIKETKAFGMEKSQKIATDMGFKFRDQVEEFGFSSVAAEGWKSPTVVVSHCKENMVPKFKQHGIQVAGPVPLMIGEPQGFVTFRVGLFGLDKLRDADKTIQDFRDVLEKMK